MPTLLTHKRAKGDLEIVETFEAGLALMGTEVKSLREGKGVLLGAHVIERGGEVYVMGMQIPAYQPKNAGDGYDPARTRKLLLKKGEILELASYLSKKGYTAVPLSVYTKKRSIKLEVGVGKGKKKFDKRADLKKRDDERYMQRAER